MSRKPGLSAVALTLTLGLAACSSSRHDPNEKFFLVSANPKVPYWQTAAAGLALAARDLGVSAELVGPDNYDPQAEVEAFKSAVAKKPAGILVSAADAGLMKDPIDAAIGQGIPVIAVDSDAPASKRLTFIGTNNYQAGLMGGKVLVDKMHGKGDVAIYTTPGQANVEDRLQGYKNVLADHPQIKISKVVDVKGDPRVAFDATSELLAKGKSIPDAFVCLLSTSCAEVADVLDRNKVTGKVIVAMDTAKNTLEWIQKGAIDATVAQKPFTMAYQGVTMLESLHHYKLAKLDGNWGQDIMSPLPVFVDTGAMLIDKSNVEAFLAQTK
jgi:ribose transport system substrate-binding protein